VFWYHTINLNFLLAFCCVFCCVYRVQMHLYEVYTILDAVWGVEACDGMIMLTFWSVLCMYSMFSECVLY
jgi:hypothetical protein